MATTFLEPGGDATFDTNLWTRIIAGTAVATDIVHGQHTRSIKFRPNTNDQVERKASVQDSGTRCSFYIYLVAYPTTTVNEQIDFNNAGDTITVISININPTGVLGIYDNAGVQVGTNGATLSLGKWYRISIAYTVTSTTVNQIRLFVNGVLSISITNGTLSTTGSANLLISNTVTDTTLDFRVSDVYVDNSNALTDPGDIWVVAKRPFSNGSSVQFTTQIGAGGSGYGTGHAPQVNERALSTTNGWSLSNTTKSTEEYSIESQAGGDFNILNATIIDYMGWIYSQVNSTANSPVHHIIVNNVATAITEATSAAAFIAFAASTTYPAGNTDIGIDAQYTTTPHLTSLFECGIVFGVTFNSPQFNSRIKPI